MKCRNYKQVLEHLNKSKQVVLTISLWTYSSPRMTFRVAFDEIKSHLDGDLCFGWGDFKIKFTPLQGEPRSFWANKLRISKVDYVEID